MSKSDQPSPDRPNVSCLRPDDISTARYALGLTRSDVDELRGLIHRECGESLSHEEAWKRAAEVLALFRMLLGPLPEDQPSPSCPQAEALTAARGAGITE